MSEKIKRLIFTRNGYLFVRLESATRVKEFGPYATREEANQIVSWPQEQIQVKPQPEPIKRRIYKRLGVWYIRLESATRIKKFGPFATREEANHITWADVPKIGRPYQTVCVNGHSLTDPNNVYIDSRGYPVCRACRAEARYQIRHMTEQEKRYVEYIRSRKHATAAE